MLSTHKESGIGMIEVLITLLILTIGLLGTAQLQLINLQNSRASEARMIATMLANDLSERMRANIMGSENGFYDSIRSSGANQDPAPSAPACQSGCSAREQADLDTREWLENITDVPNLGGDGNQHIPLLDNATADLVAAAGNTRFTLTLSWQEHDSQLRSWVDRSYIQVIEL